jgi:hypothetical protein
MYEVIKRVGSFTEILPEAPTFTEREEAERWARDFLTNHPERFARGREAIEVRRKSA